MTKIAVLCPTRGRPEQFRRMAADRNRRQVMTWFDAALLHLVDQPWFWIALSCVMLLVAMWWLG